MSDQGFHEVQLSGKQLVFLFMSAVVLMVVVFLLGVNVGRGVRSAVGDTEVAAQTDPAAAPAETTAENAEPAKPAQPELSYHDMLLSATPGADKGNAAAAKETPASARPASEAPPPVNEEPPSPPAATATPAAAARTTPAPMPTSRPAGRSDWFIQTGAYSTQAVADGQVAKLKQLNVPAFVLPPEGAVKLFRVRIGPYTDRAEAEKVSSRVARQGFTPSITR